MGFSAFERAVWSSVNFLRIRRATASACFNERLFAFPALGIGRAEIIENGRGFFAGALTSSHERLWRRFPDAPKSQRVSAARDVNAKHTATSGASLKGAQTTKPKNEERHKSEAMVSATRKKRVYGKPCKSRAWRSAVSGHANVIQITRSCNQDHRTFECRDRGYVHVEVNNALHHFTIRASRPLPSGTTVVMEPFWDGTWRSQSKFQRTTCPKCC